VQVADRFIRLTGRGLGIYQFRFPENANLPSQRFFSLGNEPREAC
jgi:hypothetical protein